MNSRTETLLLVLVAVVVAVVGFSYYEKRKTAAAPTGVAAQASGFVNKVVGGATSVGGSLVNTTTGLAVGTLGVAATVGKDAVGVVEKGLGYLNPSSWF